MTDRQWERIGAASGIGFVVAAIVASALVKIAPGVDSQPQSIVTYYLDNRTQLLWQTYIFGLALAAALWFAGSLRTHLWRAEGDTGRLANVAFGGAVAAVAVQTMFVVVHGALAYSVSTAEEGIVASLYTVLAFTGVMTWFPTAVFIGAATVITFRSKAFHPWIGVLGGALTAASLVAGAAFRSSGAMAPNDRFSLWVFAGFAAWILATSATLVVGTGAATEQPKTIYLDQPQRERLMTQEEMHRTA